MQLHKPRNRYIQMTKYGKYWNFVSSPNTLANTQKVVVDPQPPTYPQKLVEIDSLYCCIYSYQPYKTLECLETYLVQGKQFAWIIGQK